MVIDPTQIIPVPKKPTTNRPANEIPSTDKESEAIKAAEIEHAVVEKVQPEPIMVEDTHMGSKTVETVESTVIAGAQPPQVNATTVSTVGGVEQPEKRPKPKRYESEISFDDKMDLAAANPSLHVSNKIDIIGFSSHAKFLAHALSAGQGLPPIGIYAHHKSIMTRWGLENRSMSLYDPRGGLVSSHAIRCPHLIYDYRRYRYLQNPKDADFFDNLIIDTTYAAVIPSLAALRNRIDRRTTICLIHTGLGLMEKINETFFPDPLERPNFVLAHSTHKLSKHSFYKYAIKQKNVGQLHLHGVPKSAGPIVDKSSPAYEGMVQYQYFLKMLATSENLGVVGLPWVRFMTNKMPGMVFSSLADTISVILGCRYNALHPNPHAMVMWNNMLDEILEIISGFPELQGEGYLKHRLAYFKTSTFKRKLKTHLITQGTNISPWVKRVRMGGEPPIDYFNGYFIQRAKELGLDHKHNALAMEAVKARVVARKKELREDIPLGKSPYMNDGDYIGGGQPFDYSVLEQDLDSLVDEF